ncbi:SAM-dependent methyltransferase [Sphingomonas oleivorans]|uniref:site-specific DNA-methyltransferase (adenine-specific) n=2 Tax=Sphingomonas oleivorans TaxID=1735121 RepID=A0A2T5G0B9_9SPHN|nr:SAM-dependent methyltransferase [Sphingomonas oleivorans]
MDTPALRKARGAFFTPSTLARFITDWAVRSPADTVLEPSCGDAAFLAPAVDRLRALGAPVGLDGQLHGVEIHAASAKAATARLAAQNAKVEIAIGDFFDQTPPPKKFDVVIGNPPYVRYQQFAGDARAKSLQAALAQGVRLTGLASSWAAFTIHASHFLKDTGRLGLVLPAELLTVNYAAQVRRFLLTRFAKVRLVLFEELVFPDVLEEVVLLLAEGRGDAPSFEVYQARNLADLERICADSWIGYVPSGDQKWTSALLPAAALDIYARLTEGPGFTNMLGWGETYLGAVSGNNDWFSLDRAQAAKLGLKSNELLGISPPGSKHLRGLTFTQAAWESLAKEGKRCFLFAPGANPSAAARAYIAEGEAADVHKTYKCRKRSPWWRVPLVDRPDLLFTYMNHDRPRLITNDADAQFLNSLYGVKLKAAVRAIGRELLPLASLNSATLLGAEVVGRAYGGGMLKHEPKEADMLPVPTPVTLEAIADELRAIRPQIGRALRSTKPQRAVELVDTILLERHLGLSPSEVAGLRGARDLLFQRRVTRSRSERVTN